MCGINGLINVKNATIKSIKLSIGLENRGTLGAGVAFINPRKKNKLSIVKMPRSPRDLLNSYKHSLSNVTASTAIGHNRQPSHGDVSQKNTHPFYDCDKSFALVHNGVCNLESLRSYLRCIGHQIDGDTDSEVIAHCLEELLKTFSREIAFKKLIKILNHHGIYAILALFKDGEIYGLRHNEPIQIYKQNKEIYIASEIIALKEIGLIKDNDTIKVLEPKNDYVFFYKNGQLKGNFETRQINITPPSEPTRFMTVKAGKFEIEETSPLNYDMELQTKRWWQR